MIPKSSHSKPSVVRGLGRSHSGKNHSQTPPTRGLTHSLSRRSRGKIRLKTRKRVKDSAQWAKYTESVQSPHAIWKLIPYATLFILLIGLPILGFRIHSSKTQTNPPQRQNTELTAKTADPLIDKTDPPLTDEPKIFSEPPLEVAKAFATATSTKERLALARNPDEVKQRLGQYPKEALNQPAEKVIALGNASVQGLTFACFQAKFASGNKRLLCVIPSPDGPKVDWDCYAEYSSAHPQLLLDGKVEYAMLRAYLKPSFNYSYNYRDDSIWQCYLLSTSDLNLPSFYVYTKHDSPSGKVLGKILPQHYGKRMRMTLSVQANKDSYKRNQFEIAKIHSAGWVLGETDIEDAWIPGQEQ